MQNAEYFKSDIDALKQFINMLKARGQAAKIILPENVS
jgi:hypothetical protein